MPVRRIRIIADDYALSSGVSAGILELARAGRLSGTGAMVPSPRWPADARRLLDVPPGFETGLHVTLTGALSPLGPMPSLCPDGRFPALGRWLLGSHLGALSTPAAQDELKAEIARQLDAFEQAMGRPPYFVDGHQHVHLLPGIRPLLLDVIARRYPPGSVWLRDCASPGRDIIRRRVNTGKAMFIAGLARGLRQQAAQRGIPTNNGFSGIYGFLGDFPTLMHRFLDGLPDGGLVMVHPANPDDELSGLDPVVTARHAEMAYLSGDEWPARLNAAEIIISGTHPTALG